MRPSLATSKNTKTIIKMNNEIPLLEGSEFVQIAYAVMRNGERVLVPTAQMTDEELLAKANEFAERGESLKAHAQEMRKYRDTRDSSE